MPITQDRLLELLEAAEHYQKLLSGFEYSVQQGARDAKAGLRQPQEILEELSLLFSAMPTRGAGIVVTSERVRYNLTHSKNSANKKRKANKRHSGGHTLVHQTHQPTSRFDLPEPLVSDIMEDNDPMKEGNDFLDLEAFSPFRQPLAAAPPTPPAGPPAEPPANDGFSIPPELRAQIEAEAQAAVETQQRQEVYLASLPVESAIRQAAQRQSPRQGPDEDDGKEEDKPAE